MARIEAFTDNEVFTGIVDEGDYVARCVGCNPVIGKGENTKGKPQVEWRFRSVYEGKKVTFRKTTPLDGEGVGFTRDILNGLQTDYEERGRRLAWDTDDCINKPVIITMKHRTYNDEARHECSKFSPYLGDGEGLPEEEVEPWEEEATEADADE
jgi:hypothetical protein